MKASFTSPLPPTLNEQIDIARGNKYRSAEIKKRWTNAIATECYGLPSFPGKVWLSFEWQVKRYEVKDVDNTSAAAKYLLAGVITDDSLRVIQNPVIHWYSKGQNRVVVTVSDRPIITKELRKLVASEELLE